MAIVNKMGNNMHWQDCVEIRTLIYYIGENVKWYSPFEISLTTSYIVKHKLTILSILLIGNYPREMEIYFNTKKIVLNNHKSIVVVKNWE